MVAKAETPSQAPDDSSPLLTRVKQGSWLFLFFLFLLVTLPLPRWLASPLTGPLGLRDTPDAIVVFGALVYANGEPSQHLKERLLRAGELCARFPESQLILTGGRGASGVIEAEAQKRFAVQQLGLSPERIILESSSTSTWEQALWLRENAPGRWRHLALVSSASHTGRIWALLGSRISCSVLAPRWERSLDGSLIERFSSLRHLVREGLAWLYYSWKGRL